MGVIEAILAFIGLVAVVIVVIALLSDDESPLPPAEDAAAPYREGLHAAIRMQRVAQDLEQQIYAEAARQMDGQAGAEPARRP